MKKYFVAFNYVLGNGINGFANCYKTSLNNNPLPQEIEKWEEEIKNDKKANIVLVNILFFKEVN